MRLKHYLIVGTAVCVMGLAMHRGLTQSPPVIVGPGFAPNVGTPVNPHSLDYYGDYYDESYGNPNIMSAANVYNVTFGPYDIPQTSNKITTRMSGTNVTFQWEGETRAVKSVTFALVDKNNAVVTKQVITSQPVKATLKKSSKSTGYSVNVLYINGLTSSVVSPL